MPKLDLVNAKQIKTGAGEILHLKGPGFTWSKPVGSQLVQVATNPSNITTATTSSTITFAKPTQGNLLIAMFGVISTSVTMSDISGWNVAGYYTGTGYRSKVYWKKAGADEPTTITQTIGDPRHMSGQVLEFDKAAGAYSIQTSLRGQDATSGGPTALTTGPLQSIENSISFVYGFADTDSGGASIATTGPTNGFNRRLNTRPGANITFGEKVHTVSETVNPQITLAQNARAGWGLVTLSPISAPLGYRQTILNSNAQMLHLTPNYTTNVIPDETGNGRVAQLQFGTPGAYVMDGPYGLPVFKGSRTHQAFVNHDAAFNGTSWTQLAWVNPNNETGVSFMFFYSRGNTQSLGIEGTSLTNGSARYGTGNSGANLGLITTATGWSFTAITFDMTTGTGRTYTAMNGGDLILRNTNTVANSLSSLTDPIAWNGRNLNGGQSLRGNIGLAGMARWNRELSLAELTSIYNAARVNGI